MRKRVVIPGEGGMGHGMKEVQWGSKCIYNILFLKSNNMKQM